MDYVGHRTLNFLSDEILAAIILWNQPIKFCTFMLVMKVWFLCYSYMQASSSFNGFRLSLILDVKLLCFCNLFKLCFAVILCMIFTGSFVGSLNRRIVVFLYFKFSRKLTLAFIFHHTVCFFGFIISYRVTLSASYSLRVSISMGALLIFSYK